VLTLCAARFSEENPGRPPAMGGLAARPPRQWTAPAAVEWFRRDSPGGVPSSGPDGRGVTSLVRSGEVPVPRIRGAPPPPPPPPHCKRTPHRVAPPSDPIQVLGVSFGETRDGNRETSYVDLRGIAPTGSRPFFPRSAYHSFSATCGRRGAGLGGSAAPPPPLPASPPSPPPPPTMKRRCLSSCPSVCGCFRVLSLSAPPLPIVRHPHRRPLLLPLTSPITDPPLTASTYPLLSRLVSTWSEARRQRRRRGLSGAVVERMPADFAAHGDSRPIPSTVVDAHSLATDLGAGRRVVRRVLVGAG